MDDVDRRFGAEPFAHGGFGGVRGFGVAQAEGVVAKLAHGGDQTFPLGEREADALVLRDRGAEGLALGNVGPAFIKRCLGDGASLQADQRPAVVEALHDLDEAHAFIGQTVADGNADVVEKD